MTTTAISCGQIPLSGKTTPSLLLADTELRETSELGLLRQHNTATPITKATSISSVVAQLQTWWLLSFLISSNCIKLYGPGFIQSFWQIFFFIKYMYIQRYLPLGLGRYIILHQVIYYKILSLSTFCLINPTLKQKKQSLNLIVFCGLSISPPKQGI